MTGLHVIKLNLEQLIHILATGAPATDRGKANDTVPLYDMVKADDMVPANDMFTRMAEHVHHQHVCME